MAWKCFQRRWRRLWRSGWESALTGHWQIRVAEKLRLHASPNGNIAWDQAALLNAMDRFWADAFKTVYWDAPNARL